jgi:hypothetical protein
MRNAADVAGGKPIAVKLQSISGATVPTAGAQAFLMDINNNDIYGQHIRRTGHNPPLWSSADWVLTTGLPKHGGARDNKFLSPIQCLTDVA